MYISDYKAYLGKDGNIEDRQTLVVERLLEHEGAAQRGLESEHVLRERMCQSQYPHTRQIWVSSVSYFYKVVNISRGTLCTESHPLHHITNKPFSQMTPYFLSFDKMYT